MNKYYSIEDTPLGFHKFNWYVAIPIGVLIDFWVLCKIVLNMVNIHWLYIFIIIILLAEIALLISCFVGFFRWKKYAWYCLMIDFIVGFVCQMYIWSISISTRFGPILISCIIVTLKCIYYIKRQPLFFPEMAANRIDIKFSNSYRTFRSSPEIKYCHKCGFELFGGSKFCSNCGTSVITKEKVDTDKETNNLESYIYDSDKHEVKFESRKMESVRCPCCYAIQKSDRNSCFKCGSVFVYEDES
jgi:hypothetical protein